MADPAAADAKDQKKVPQQYDLVADYPPKVNRRSFMMSWAGAAWAAFGAANAVGGVAMLRFMLPNVLFEPPQVFKAGKIEDYEWDKPDERFKVDKKCWIVKLHKDWNGKAVLAALDTTCTHLGCTPNWLSADEKFKCPCHGSGFIRTGINVEGPAPRPLERFKITLADDGQILIDKNTKYQEEKGQWILDGAYLTYVA
jgi:cytochrome b6-f complex iron-sulfur subunit